MPLTRKSKLIIIIIVSALVFCGGLTAILLTVVIPKNLEAPEPRLVAVIGEPDYTVTFSWDKSEGAAGYAVEYKYSLYPGEVKSAEVGANSISVKRLKGEIEIRVKAKGKRPAKDSGFSDWKAFAVGAVKLDAPRQPIFFLESETAGENTVYFYRVAQNSWQEVTYTYKGEVKRIDFYDVVIVPPGGDEDTAFSDPMTMTATEFKLGKRYFTDPGEWKIYIRAVNHKGEFGEFGSLPGEPVELFELFAPGDWTLSTVIVP